MRLLNTENGDMTEFIGDQIPHEYAILSHRWGNEEVSYHDWLKRSSSVDVRSRRGYDKINLFCNQAKKDGMKWAWIDTCCIDKRSSQDLSEAINSMFKWYRNSSVCYAHLEDYDSSMFDVPSLGKSEWFSRGWTLQELLAPSKVNFYDRTWHYIGTKTDPDMCRTISEITKIDTKFLLGDDLESASIAKKMSWASKRKTTRAEDTAYSLLGLFDINMPLLYGEGTKAFQRLQEEIMKLYPADHSLYAWGMPVDKCSMEMPLGTSIHKNLRTLQDWTASPEPLYGLLARSPQDFEFSQNYSPISWASNVYNTMYERQVRTNCPVVIGKGIRIDLPIVKQFPFAYQFSEPTVSQIRVGQYAILLCQDDTDELVTPCLPLLFWGSGFTARVGELYLDRSIPLPDKRPARMVACEAELNLALEIKPKLKAGDVVLRSILDFRLASNGISANYIYWDNYGKGTSANFDNVIRVKTNQRALPYYGITNKKPNSDDPENWSIVLGRTDVDTLDFPAFQVSIIPYNADADMFAADYVCEKTFQMYPDQVCFIINTSMAIMIHVERLSLAEKGEYIDIVDITVLEPQQIPRDDKIPIVNVDYYVPREDNRSRDDEPAQGPNDRNKKAVENRSVPVRTNTF